jgi:hypothetical protein
VQACLLVCRLRRGGAVAVLRNTDASSDPARHFGCLGGEPEACGRWGLGGAGHLGNGTATSVCGAHATGRSTCRGDRAGGRW